MNMLMAAGGNSDGAGGDVSKRSGGAVDGVVTLALPGY
jgi:hypothetical protein